MDRHAAVSSVLWRVLLLNLVVAAAKIALGLATGAVSILSDGFHSLTDTGSNVIGIIGVRAASRPPDANHPYGHRKFETLASGGILVFLVVVLTQVVATAVSRLRDQTPPHRILQHVVQPIEQFTIAAFKRVGLGGSGDVIRPPPALHPNHPIGADGGNPARRQLLNILVDAKRRGHPAIA